jgi:hypothetical protein
MSRALDLRKFATLELRRFKIPDLRRSKILENSFHQFRNARRFEGDGFSWIPQQSFACRGAGWVVLFVFNGQFAVGRGPSAW